MNAAQASSQKTWTGHEPITLGLLYALAFGGFFLLFLGMALADDVNTIQLHIEGARILAEGAKFVPHFGYHGVLIFLNHVFGMPYEYAAAYTLATMTTLSLGLLQYIIVHGLRLPLPAWTAFAFAGVIILATAIYVPGISTNFYHGTGAVSVWQNSTMLFVRPIGLATFLCLLATIGQDGRELDLRYAAATGLLCALSVVGKPNFALVFLPAVAVWMLVHGRLRSRDVLMGLLVAGPSFLILSAQYFLTYGEGGEGNRSIAFDDFGLWAEKFSNVPLAIVLTLAFPLAVALFRTDSLRTNRPLQLAWLMTLFGILQRGFLKENEHAWAGNWSWGFLIALTYIFVFSFTELLSWTTENPRRWDRVLQAACAALLGLHLLAGIGFVLNP